MNSVERGRLQRLAWWRRARFGMFIHWGLYSQLGRGEWAMNRERIPAAEYDKLADQWKTKPKPARAWARLARAAGMKYMVLTAKHHEGFCLWDTRQTEFNAVRRRPRRDLVAEYVAACREFGLRVGLYYSLMDWRHPDGIRAWNDLKARRRLLDFTRGCVREILSNYGKIDILWYDAPWPMWTAEMWEARKMNAMVRQLQPEILINNRTYAPEDFGTPEEHIQAAESGRAWEACMTLNGMWGYAPPFRHWLSAYDVVEMLARCSGGGGNLLLNIGPRPDGTAPQQAVTVLNKVGRWLAVNGEAAYGNLERADLMLDQWNPQGSWSVKGRTAYLWCRNWFGGHFTLGGMRCRVKHVSLLAHGKPVAFEQRGERLFLKGLPAGNPDKIAGLPVLKIECAGQPSQALGPGMRVLRIPHRWPGT